MDYFLHILILCGIYTILTVSLDLTAGHLGLLSIAHAAFYGLGAYTTAIMTTRFGISFPLATLSGMGAGALLSLLISLPSLRLRGDYFIIATFGFQMIGSSILNNWQGITGGPMGIGGIAQPSVFGWAIQSHAGFMALTFLFAAGSYWAVICITNGPFGRVLHAIREDEAFTQSLGKNVVVFKVAAVAVSAAMASLAGGLYACYMSYIDPTSFTIMESILIVSMVIVGGAGGRWGPAVGVAVLIILPEIMRFAGLPSSVAANLRQILYGALLVLMMMFRPRGLLGRYDFGGQSEWPS